MVWGTIMGLVFFLGAFLSWRAKEKKRRLASARRLELWMKENIEKLDEAEKAYLNRPF